MVPAGRGHPARGVISPLLANIYLHDTLDTWFETDVKPRLVGRNFMLRFADDVVMVFSNEKDARRVLAVLPKRLGKYGLTLHPTKTRLLHFRPGGMGQPPQPGGRSFEFLGFTHFWARSRRGPWVVMRRTAGSRLTRAVKRIYEWLRHNRHRPIRWQHHHLVPKLRGHYNYYGITGNARSLYRFRYEVTGAWIKWLGRRSNARMSWTRFRQVLDRFPLPAPVVRHWIWTAAANP